MNSLTECTVGCPYCGEALDVLIDDSEAGQEYIEDCQVCCKPIVFKVGYTALGELEVIVHSEDETY